MKGLRQIGRNVKGRIAREPLAPKLPQTKAITDIPDETDFWVTQEGQLRAAMQPEIDAILAEGIAEASRFGLAVNFQMANETVVRAAEGYWDTWWNGLQNTTRESMRSSIGRHLSTSSSRRQLVNELSPLFGRERAKMIATTETTRLYAVGNEAAFEAAGVVNNEWRTVMDSRVDPICEALEGKRKIEDERTERPPAHVRCRCWIAPITEGRTITEEGEVAETYLDPTTLGDSFARDDWARNNLMSWQNNPDLFTAAERSALEAYKTGDFARIDKFFRTGIGDAETRMWARNIESAMTKGSVSENLTVWRTVGNAPPELWEALQSETLIGQVIVDEGFASTTLNRLAANNWAGSADTSFILEIRIPKGARGIYMEGVGSPFEEELLLRASARMRVTNISGPPNRRVVQVVIEG